MPALSDAMENPGSISAAQMKRVLDVTRLLTVTADLDLLLLRIAECSCDMLGCERASIFLHDAAADQLWTKIALQSQEIRVRSDAGIVGHVFKTNQLLHEPNPYQNPRFNPEPDRRSGFVTRNLLTAPMLDLTGKPVGVIQAVNKKAGSFNSVDETMIQLLADQAGVAIQRYHLQQSAVEAMALRREMDLAKQVQQALIPDEPPKIAGIDCAGWNKAASITGGDCYDLWRTSDGRLGIFLGDATGHGIGPALVVSQTRTLVRALCEIKPDPHELLIAANARLADDLELGKFVTAFLGFLSPDGTLQWSSAGHSPILVRRNASANIEELEPPAPPLGIMPDFLGDPSPPIQLEADGALYVSSDGIVESFSPQGQLFDIGRLIPLLSEGSPQEVIARVQAAMRQWQGNDEPKDDQTFVAAQLVPAR